MTWTGLLSSLYVLEELGSDAEFSGLLLPHHFSCALGGIAKK